MHTLKTNKILIGALAILFIIISIQCLFIFKLYKNSNKTIELNDSNSSKIQVNTKPIAPKNNASPQTTIPPKQNNKNNFGFNSFFDDFEMDSWNPFEEMRERMDNMFQNSLSRFRSSHNFKDLMQDDFFSPDLDVKEDSNTYIIRLDLPGMEKSNIIITLNDRVLNITASRDVEHNENKNNQILRQERYQGQFKRSLTLPGPVDEEKMEAEYKDGVLTIKIPKTATQKTKKQVKII